MIDHSKIDFEELINKIKGALYLNRNFIGYMSETDNIDSYKFTKIVHDFLDKDHVDITHDDVKRVIEIMCTLDNNIKTEYENARKIMLNEITKMHREILSKPYIPISMYA